MRALILVCLCAAPAVAEAKRVITVDEAVKLAVDSSPQLKSARLRQEASTIRRRACAGACSR